MSINAHPQMTEAMEHLQRFNAALEDQMRARSAKSFTATDEAETVEVTVNADLFLTSLHIEAGLLRQGAKSVEHRINEALQNAQSAVYGSIEGDQERFVSALSEIAGALTKMLEK